jgi:hypothetical protein
MLALLGTIPLTVYPETINAAPVDEDSEESSLK